MNLNPILIVEDDPAISDTIALTVKKHFQLSVKIAPNLESAFQLLSQQEHDIVITDLRLPDGSGLDLIKHLHAEKSGIPIILMTGHGTAQTAIDAMKAGAFDYILKPFNPTDLLPLIEKATLMRSLNSSRAVRIASEEGVVDDGTDMMIGRTPQMLEVFKQIGVYSPKSVTILITGESGTGKELIARSIWQNSIRHDTAFVAVNCAAIPENLMESEFFGSAKGAYTGAVNTRVGRFEQANGGTLFLDEVGELPLEMQGKLLRTLQEGVVQPIGSSRDIKVDVRIIAATNRNLVEEVEAGTFREDLFYRLNVATIQLPSLRERKEDIEPIFKYLLFKNARELDIDVPAVDEGLFEFFKEYSWPGNVRELENSVKNALLHSRGFALSIADFKLLSSKANASGVDAEAVDTCCSQQLEQKLKWIRESLNQDSHFDLKVVTDLVEKEFLAEVLKKLNWNQTQTAKVLGLSRQTLINKLKALSIEKAEFS